jgi:tetratricopeptide (TPR) repeat protein
VRRHPLAIFLAAVFAAKLIVLVQLWDHPLLQASAGLDTTVYTSLASQVLAGNTSLAPGLYFVSPLYIYFLAAALSVFQSLTAVRVIQIAFGTMAVWMIFVGARAWFGERAAWMAAVLAALTGLFTFHEVLILQAALDPFLTAVALTALALAFTARRSLPWFALSGLAFGVQTLNRPNVLIPCLVILAMLAIARRWRPAVVMAAGLAVALSPVIIRNVVVAGDWSPGSSHGGLNFYIGNSADANGTYHVLPGITPNIAGQRQDARRVAEQSVGRPLSDSEVSAYFYGLGWTWMRLHPGDALALFARKLAYTFNSAYITLNYSYPFYAYDVRTLLALLFVGPWLLIPVGFVGLAIGTPVDRRVEYFIWLSFVPAYAIAVAVFFVTERYRLPLLVPLCMGSGVAIERVWSLFRRVQAGGAPPHSGGFRLQAEGARFQPDVFALIAIIPLAVLVNWPLHLDDGRAEERTRMAEAMVARDDYDEAEAWVQKAERDHPSPGVLHFRVARLYILRHKPERAIEHLKKSMRVDPNQPEVDYAYGQALVDAGRPADAIPHLQNALRAGIRVDLAGYDLARALAATGNRAGALQILQMVKPENPKDADSWDALGQLAMQLESPSLAAAFFNQAIAAAPNTPRPMEDLGLALAMMGRYPEAISNFENALRVDPTNAGTHLNIAVAYAEAGRIADARAHAQEALRLKPDYVKARQFLAALPKGR